MKRRLTPCLFCMIFLMVLGCKTEKNNHAEKTPELRVVTYNIRRAYDQKWDQNKQEMANQIQFYHPDFMGIQEGLHRQVQYLKKHIDGMKYIGAGRVDGHQKGEYEAIFYNNRRFKLVTGTDSTMWLSATPGQPGKGWDAAYPRVVTWGKFRDNASGRAFYMFNTHLDNVGDTARVRGAKLINQTIKKMATDAPVFVTGDFNSTPESRPYHIMTSDGLRDAYKISDAPPVGPAFTYAGGTSVCDTTADRKRIDYVFVSKQWKVRQTAVISNFNNGLFPSDHIPFVADLTLKDISK